MSSLTIDRLRFAVVRFTGADAREFLQGQVSCDLRKLTATHALLGACNSPQGRVQSVFTLIERGDGIAMILPEIMLDSIQSRLRKYILRSKVSLHDERQRLHVALLDRQHLLARGIDSLDAIRAHRETNNASILRWHDATYERYLSITEHTVPSEHEISEHDWRLADVRAGLPHLFPATYEAFTAQMLNLDLLDGISFEKGCYTGQEIIARTHYRGSIKRRMLRFAAACSPPHPGTRLLTNNEHAGDVVYAAETPQGCEVLAVANLANAESELIIDTESRTILQRLELPYSLQSDSTN